MFVKSTVVAALGLVFALISLSNATPQSFVCKLILTNETVLEEVVGCGKGLPSRVFMAVEHCRMKVAKGKSIEEVAKLQCTDTAFAVEFGQCQLIYLELHGGAMTDSESRTMLEYEVCQLNIILKATEGIDYGQEIEIAESQSKETSSKTKEI